MNISQTLQEEFKDAMAQFMEIQEETFELTGKRLTDEFVPPEEIEETPRQKQERIEAEREKRIQNLEEVGNKMVEGLPGLITGQYNIKFRPIFLGTKNRIHSLLVDIYQLGLRYTPALQKRLCMGYRNPEKWEKDLREAVTIGLSKPPVRLPSTKLTLKKYTRRGFLVEIGETSVTFWENIVMKAIGDTKTILQIVDTQLETDPEMIGEQIRRDKELTKSLTLKSLKKSINAQTLEDI